MQAYGIASAARHKPSGDTSYRQDDNWWKRARCLGHDLRLWFPSSERRDGYSKARAICKRCPVQLECLEDAVRGDARYGMFGGLTPNERARITDPSIIRHPR